MTVLCSLLFGAAPDCNALRCGSNKLVHVHNLLLLKGQLGVLRLKMYLQTYTEYASVTLRPYTVHAFSRTQLYIHGYSAPSTL